MAGYMSRTQIFEEYDKDVKLMTESYEIIKEGFAPESLDMLCAFRNINLDANPESKILRDELERLNFGFSSMVDTTRLHPALITKSGRYLQEGRFIIPIEDFAGNLLTLVGYFPDQRKYITTNVPFYSKKTMLYNFKKAYELSKREYSGLVYVVEGYFDCIALQSLGLPAVATLGSNVSMYKKTLLELFKKVIAIPDGDAIGYRALNRFSPQGWQVPSSATMIKFIGGEWDNLRPGGKVKIKDMWDFVNYCSPDDVRDCLLQFADSREEIEVLDLTA